MSAPFEPTNYDIQVYPLGQSGVLPSDQWIDWNSANPLTISFTSGLAVKSLWFPNPQGPMSFYAGDNAMGVPFYTTDGAVPEIVSIPNDAPVVTVTGPGPQFYVYASTIAYAPSRSVEAPNLNIQVVAPITNLGTASQPIIGLQTPLAKTLGGTGSSNPPGVIAGSGVNIVGVFPAQTISVNPSVFVSAVTASAPLNSSGGTTPNISLVGIVALANGGTGYSDPALTPVVDANGFGLEITGDIFNPTGGSAWTIENTGVSSLTTDDSYHGAGAAFLQGADGIVTEGTTASGASHLKVSGINFPLISGITSPDGSIAITGSGQNVHLEVADSGVGAAYGAATEFSSGTTTPGGSLNIGPLPAGQWLAEAYCVGLSIGGGAGTATLSLSASGSFAAEISDTGFQRVLWMAQKVTSTGSLAPSCTLSSTGTCVVDSNFTFASFVLKATRLS